MIFGYALTAFVGVPPRRIGVNNVKLFLWNSDEAPFLTSGQLGPKFSVRRCVPELSAGSGLFQALPVAPANIPGYIPEWNC